MPSSDPVRRFEDIVANIDRIYAFVAEMDECSFRDDDKVNYAVQHALLIISEAAHKLGDQAEAACPGVRWAEIRGLGNRIRHEYDRIDPARLWYLIERDLPILRAAVAAALLQLEDSATSPDPLP